MTAVAASDLPSYRDDSRAVFVVGPAYTNRCTSYLKRSIKIYIKTAPTCFGIITILRERTI